MKILYVFPHPDDESFGPAPAISRQRREGDEVYLLTLTKGEATKQRHRLGVTKKRMGEIRFNEMKCVEDVLDLSGMTVLDFPDNELKEMDPILLEEAIERHIHKIQPDILVTYAVHGISGFHDHLVTHAVVKRVYCNMMRENSPYPRRLAFFTFYSEGESRGKFDLNSSSEEEIDCWVKADRMDMEKFENSLECYETYQEVIEESGVKEEIDELVPFEIFKEDFDPPLDRLTMKLER